MAVDPNSFIWSRSFFANKKKTTFANLCRTPRLSFAGVSCQNLSRNLSPKQKILLRTQKKTKKLSRRLMLEPWGPGGLCSGQSLHGPLDRQSNRYIIISNLTVRHGKPPILIGKSSTNGPWLPQHRAADGQQRRQHVQNGPTPQEEDCAEPSLAVTSSKTTWPLCDVLSLQTLGCNPTTIGM